MPSEFLRYDGQTPGAFAVYRPFGIGLMATMVALGMPAQAVGIGHESGAAPVEITPDQLAAHPAVRALMEASATAAAEAAVRAIKASPDNAPAPGDRPGGTGANVNLNRPQRLSLARTITALRDHSWTGAELERDFVQATRSLYPIPDADGNSAILPATRTAFGHVLEESAINLVEGKFRDFAVRYAPAVRDAGEGSAAAGGALVPAQYLQDLFTLSLQTAVAFRNAPGVDTIPVRSNLVYHPRETVMPTSAAYAEAGVIAESDPTFAQQSITIRKQASLNKFSNELLADATPEYEAYIARSITRSVALLQDFQFLEGPGTGANVVGLGSYAGLTAGYAPATNGDSYSAAGAADKLIDLVFLARAAGWEPSAWIMHPRTLQSLSKLKDTNNRYILESIGGNFGAPRVIPDAGALQTNIGPNPAVWRAMLLGYPVLLTSQLPINETQGTSLNASHVYLGDFNFARVLERQAIEIAMADQIYFTTDQTAVRAAARSAVLLTAPAAFIKQGGIIP